jgi:hypothetical protein
MALLSAEEIFKIDDVITEDLEVPEWNGTIRLKMLTGAERDFFEASMVKSGKGGQQERNMANFRARMIGMCAVDDQGRKLFATNPAVKELGKKSSKALSRIFDKCQEMNGLTEADVEELSEGFDDAPSEDSTSD